MSKNKKQAPPVVVHKTTSPKIWWTPVAGQIPNISIISAPTAHRKNIFVGPSILKSWVTLPLTAFSNTQPIRGMTWKEKQKELGRQVYNTTKNIGCILYAIDHYPGHYSVEFIERFNALKVFRNRKICDHEYLRQCPVGLKGKDKCKKCIKYMKTKTIWEIRDSWKNNNRHPDWGKK